MIFNKPSITIDEGKTIVTFICNDGEIYTKEYHRTNEPYINSLNELKFDTSRFIEINENLLIPVASLKRVKLEHFPNLVEKTY